MLHRGLGVMVATCATLVATACVTAPRGTIGQPQIAIAANENKVADLNRVQQVAADPPPDSITLLDIGVMPLRVVAELDVPTSVAGPPLSVAIAPDLPFVIGSAATRTSPDDPKTSLHVLRFDGPRLTDTGHRVLLPADGAAIRAAYR